MNKPVLSDDKKIIVIFRVEPGCLGPDGADHVEAFCLFAMQHITQLHANFVKWSVLPMYDKSLPEIEFRLGKMGLPDEKVNRYLTIFDNNLDDFEMIIIDKISELINQFLGR